MLNLKKHDIPDFSVRISRRARHVWFRISPKKGLEVVVPRGFNCKRLPSIILKEKDWIKRNFRKLQTREKAMKREQSRLPDIIHLNAIGESWSVIYERDMFCSPTLIPKQSRKRLILRYRDHNPDELRRLLANWLREKAMEGLIPQLHKISRRHQIPFNKVTIRGQNTIWGSCSRKKNLSINYKLLFAPPEVARYVLIHELCHTVHLNHSKRFWSLVSRLAPDYRDYNRELKKAWNEVPGWINN